MDSTDNGYVFVRKFRIRFSKYIYCSMLLGYQITDLQIKTAISFRSLILHLIFKRVYPEIYLSNGLRFVREFHRKKLSICS